MDREFFNYASVSNIVHTDSGEPKWRNVVATNAVTLLSTARTIALFGLRKIDSNENAPYCKSLPFPLRALLWNKTLFITPTVYTRYGYFIRP